MANGAQKRKENKPKIADELKEHCPPGRRKDLDALVKKLKGDKEKIGEQIAEWWNEPLPVDEKWEDVAKKTLKKPTRSHHNRDRDHHGRGGGGGRGGFGRSGDRGGRGGHGRGMVGGRGGGPDRERRHRDGGGRDRDRERSEKNQRQAETDAKPAAPQEKKEIRLPGTPAPVVNERPLKGVWGQRAAAPAPEPAAAAPVASTPVSPPVEDVKPEEPEQAVEVGVVTEQDPTPAGFVEPPVEDVIEPIVEAPPTSKPVVAAAPTAPAARMGGNVWATRGSAHLIRAEKPQPPAPKIAQKQPEPIVELSTPTEITSAPIEETPLSEPINEDPIVPTPAPEDALDSGLPASVNGANINAAGWKPLSENGTSSVPSADIVIPSPVGPVSIPSETSVGDVPLLDVTASVKETIVPVVKEELETVPTGPSSAESSLKPTSILNLGHWETGEGEDTMSHEFGFGSFGQENDVASVDEITMNSTTNESAQPPMPPAPVAETISAPPATAASTVSPARPPPGLGLGMPPMPDKIVHVHELENRLESASLAEKKEDVVNEKVENLPTANDTVQTSTTAATAPTVGQATTAEGFVQMPPGAMSSYTGQYGGMGMYNYNAQNPAVTPNGFMGVATPAGPVLSSGVLPQQPKQQNVTQPAPGLPQQGSLYGAPSPAQHTTETISNTESSNPAPTNGGMPPGMHAGMPQYNPALFYGQQPYQMGQPHGVGAYGYGYGQFGGVQGGFGYQQVMGQGAGYAQGYEEQAQHHGNHNNNNNHQGGGYNGKSNGGGGGYRGRNNHHNNHHQNQYQNQYNPQGHGGYGGQPYNMGYNDFNQRGGYGHGTMDPYMQNSGGYQSNFSNQDDGQQIGKGKAKGGNNRNFGSNPNMQQYQQGPQGGNQSQQQNFGLQGAGVSDPSGGTNGLNYQNWGGGGL